MEGAEEEAKVAAAAAAVESGEAAAAAGAGESRRLSVVDLILRMIAAGATLASGVAMGTTNQTLPFFTQFTRYQAQFSDLPAFTFFVVANGLVCCYLLLLLPLSVIHIVRGTRALRTRLLLLILDTVALVLVTAGGSAAAAIVYLAHKGNSSANWAAICQQFNSFCGRITGSLLGSFLAVVVIILLIVFSTLVLSKC